MSKPEIQGDTHSVEYTPDDQLGERTLFLRVNGQRHAVPIFVDNIEDVINLFLTGKSAIWAFDEAQA